MTTPDRAERRFFMPGFDGIGFHWLCDRVNPLVHLVRVQRVGTVGRDAPIAAYGDISDQP
jgi:hypothetical protein